MALGSTRLGTTASALVATLAVLPGTAMAQPIDPSTLPGASGVTLAGASFVVVGVVGAAFLTWSRPFVDEAVDDTMDRPAISVLYGLVAFVLAGFAGLYSTDLISRVGMVGTPLGYVALAVLVVAVCSVAGLGYLVAGTMLTDVFGERDYRLGLLFGAGISAVWWPVLPYVVAVPLWILVAAVGVGGTTRTWVHEERPVEGDVDS